MAVVEELEPEPGLAPGGDDGPFGGLGLTGLPALTIDLPISAGGATLTIVRPSRRAGAGAAAASAAGPWAIARPYGTARRARQCGSAPA